MNRSLQTHLMCIWAAGFVAVLIGNGPALAQEDRNPFDLPRGIQFLSQMRQVPAGLVLQAIVSGKTRRWATINDRNYAEGDKVEGYAVVAIGRDRVLLADGAGRVELVLKRPSIPIQVTRPADPR